MRTNRGPFSCYVGIVPTGYLSRENLATTIQEGFEFCRGNSALRQIEKRAKDGKKNPRILVKPDATLSGEHHFPNSATHPDFLKQVLSQVLGQTPDSRVDLLLESQLPTDGYKDLQKTYLKKMAILDSNAISHGRYQLSKGEVFRKGTPSRVASTADALVARAANELVARAANELVARATNETDAPLLYSQADYKIFIPKLKSNLLLDGFSGALALGINGCLDSLRLADFLEICCPDLVISDAIIVPAGGGRYTQKGQELGLVLVADNPVAHDFVACMILDLDPMHVTHLRAAIERGWGPSQLSQIELGGMGSDGIRLLLDKTKLWEKPFIDFKKIPDKFEEDNPDLKLRLEALTGEPTGLSGPLGLAIDFLYSIYDTQSLRAKMGKWVPCSFVTGYIRQYPANDHVYAIGSEATRALRDMESHSRVWFNRLGITLAAVQLKNGKHYWVTAIPGSATSETPRVSEFGARNFLGKSRANSKPVVTNRLALDEKKQNLHESERPGSSAYSHKPPSAQPLVGD